MVAAQSAMAAQRTVTEGRLHSLHAYFLRGGAYGEPIRFQVHRLRDGRTYTTRRVVAEQHGEAIFSLAASFTRPEEGGEHQSEMPEVPEPETLPLWEDVRRSFFGANLPSHVQAFEARVPEDDGQDSARRYVWLRPRGALPADPLVHAAATVYASDRTLASTAVSKMGYRRGDISVTSLDHALWLHREPRLVRCPNLSCEGSVIFVISYIHSPD